MTVPKGTGSKRDMSGLNLQGVALPPEQAAASEPARRPILDPASLMDWIQGLLRRSKA